MESPLCIKKLILFDQLYFIMLIILDSYLHNILKHQQFNFITLVFFAAPQFGHRKPSVRLPQVELQGQVLVQRAPPLRTSPGDINRR
jgi:hypothetical protein